MSMQRIQTKRFVYPEEKIKEAVRNFGEKLT